jgi:hypothetical protein
LATNESDAFLYPLFFFAFFAPSVQKCKIEIEYGFQRLSLIPKGLDRFVRNLSDFGENSVAVYFIQFPMKKARIAVKMGDALIHSVMRESRQVNGFFVQAITMTSILRFCGGSGMFLDGLTELICPVLALFTRLGQRWFAIMNRNVILIVVALVVVLAIAVVFGRGLLPGGETSVVSGTAGEVASDVTNPSASSAGQSYASAMAPLVEQFQQWQAGPIAQRAEALEAKMENAGALSNLTYGNFLLLYLQAQATGRNDLAMDWVVQETISPSLQPIYETIVADSAALMTSINELSPPADLAEHQDRLIQCLDYENKRSQAIVDVLSGTSSITVPARSTNPCAALEPSIEAIDSFVVANP